MVHYLVDRKTEVMTQGVLDRLSSNRILHTRQVLCLSIVSHEDLDAPLRTEDRLHRLNIWGKIRLGFIPQKSRGVRLTVVHEGDEVAPVSMEDISSAAMNKGLGRNVRKQRVQECVRLFIGNVVKPDVRDVCLVKDDELRQSDTDLQVGEEFGI